MIGIIGGDGFIGSNLVEALGGVSINRLNYDTHSDTLFDVIINANGNSKRYWANNNPIEDFNLSVLSVYKSLFDFKYKKYVYMSSITAEQMDGAYGFHKHLSEELVKRYCGNYSIVRLPLVIGAGSTKGVVSDILNGNTVYLTRYSRLMIIDVKEVAMRLDLLLYRHELGELERFYPNDNINIWKIGEILGKKIKYADTTRDECYNYKGEFKSSEFYLNKCK